MPKCCRENPCASDSTHGGVGTWWTVIGRCLPRAILSITSSPRTNTHVYLGNGWESLNGKEDILRHNHKHRKYHFGQEAVTAYTVAIKPNLAVFRVYIHQALYCMQGDLHQALHDIGPTAWSALHAIAPKLVRRPAQFFLAQTDHIYLLKINHKPLLLLLLLLYYYLRVYGDPFPQRTLTH